MLWLRLWISMWVCESGSVWLIADISRSEEACEKYPEDPWDWYFFHMNGWFIYINEGEYTYIWILLDRNTTPKMNECLLKRDYFNRKCIWTNHCFPGSSGALLSKLIVTQPKTNLNGFVRLVVNISDIKMQRDFFVSFMSVSLSLGVYPKQCYAIKQVFFFETPSQKCGQLESIMSLLAGNPTYGHLWFRHCFG